VAGRGSEFLADYRSQLVAEQSKRHLIDAAKQVRPEVRVIIKYPNWYEGTGSTATTSPGSRRSSTA